MTSNREIEQRIALEKSIVRGLIRHLNAAGFVPAFVDSDKVTGEKQAMEAVFAVDVSRLTFRGKTHRHAVLLVGGNGEDIISDWGYTEGDPDGFNAAMDAYCDKLNEEQS